MSIGLDDYDYDNDPLMIELTNSMTYGLADQVFEQLVDILGHDRPLPMTDGRSVMKINALAFAVESFIRHSFVEDERQAVIASLQETMEDLGA